VADRRDLLARQVIDGTISKTEARRWPQVVAVVNHRRPEFFAKRAGEPDDERFGFAGAYR
jgi:hypothetical protein